MDVYDPFAEPARDEASKTLGKAEGKRRRWDDPMSATVAANVGTTSGSTPQLATSTPTAEPLSATLAALAAASGGNRPELASAVVDGGAASGAVPTQPFLKRRVLCSHFANNDCRWGNDCRFSHDVEQLRAGAPATTELDFSRLECDVVTRAFKIPRKQQGLMTESTRQLLAKAAGGCCVTWEPSEEQNRVTIVGGARQVDRAGSLLRRLCKHCSWGVSPARISGILSPTGCTSVRIRLSPTATTLKQASACLTASKPQLTIGSGASNDLVIQGRLLSRAHTEIEFFPAKGAVYVVDVSTNGTFLNGERLPPRRTGKVFVSHGDELLFPDGKTKDDLTMDFGYIVNLEFL